MSKFKLKLNSAGVKQLLKSDEMQAIVAAKASEIRTRCGDGYEQDLRVGKNRVNSMVWASTPKALKDNAENNTILKAVR